VKKSGLILFIHKLFESCLSSGPITFQQVHLNTTINDGNALKQNFKILREM